MARRQGNRLATPKNKWPQVKGGRNVGRSVNGGSGRQSGRKGEATRAFPVQEWPKPTGK